MLGLPLQPMAGWSRNPLLKSSVIILMIVTGLGLLGWLGVSRRPPTAVVITGPSEPLAYAHVAERMIAGAQHRIWLLQYVIRPDDDGVVTGLLSALAAAHARGVEVRVGLDAGMMYGSKQRDSKNDAAAAWLAAHGITVVWDETDCISHAKILIVDDHAALVGSHNWTRSALTTNREVSVVVTDPQQIARIRELVAGLPKWAE